MPPSIKTRAAISVMAISEDSAAQKSARKKMGRKICPAGTRSNSRGTQMNVRPTLPAAMASSASEVDKMAKAVGRMAIPANSDAKLLPTPIATELTTTSSSLRT